jgi:hypothetical protein
MIMIMSNLKVSRKGTDTGVSDAVPAIFKKRLAKEKICQGRIIMLWGCSFLFY